jgi:hypothetical protein
VSELQEEYVWYTRRCRVHNTFLPAGAGALCGPCGLEMQQRCDTLPEPLRQKVEFYTRLDRNGDTHKFARPVGTPQPAGLKLVAATPLPAVPRDGEHDSFESWTPPEAG